MAIDLTLAEVDACASAYVHSLAQSTQIVRILRRKAHSTCAMDLHQAPVTAGDAILAATVARVTPLPKAVLPRYPRVERGWHCAHPNWTKPCALSNYTCTGPRCAVLNSRCRQIGWTQSLLAMVSTVQLFHREPLRISFHPSIHAQLQELAPAIPTLSLHSPRENEKQKKPEVTLSSEFVISGLCCS